MAASTSYGSGVQTAPSLSLALTYGSLDYNFTIPTIHHFDACQLRDAFIAILSKPTREIDQAGEPSSVVELVGRYLGFVAKEVVDSGSSALHVLKNLLQEFDREFLCGDDIHTLAATLSGTREKKLNLVRSYYTACSAVGQPLIGRKPALLTNGKTCIYAIFGGQGLDEEYFDELREIFTTYLALIEDFIISATDYLQQLARSPNAKELHPKGPDVLSWLNDKDAQPSKEYLISAPVSFPLIGLIQLAHYLISSKNALSILFWVGLRSQQAHPRTYLDPDILQNSITEGDGVPTPMLSLCGLPLETVQQHIDTTNEHLPKDKHICISLVNSARSFVITGPPLCLYVLNLQLRKLKAAATSNCEERFSNRFLPITAPFHSPYLTKVIEDILRDLDDIKISSTDLGIPVYDTCTGENLKANSHSNIIPNLVNMICKDLVSWEDATVMPNATHIIDFGPGGTSGIGVLTGSNKEGTGVRIILAGAMDGSNTKLSYKPEIFNYSPEHRPDHA